MDYKEKYEQLTKFIKDLYSFMSDYCKEKAEGVIPELKESEDERIRKSIIGFLKTLASLKDGKTVSNEDFNSESLLEWATWLEKQGEKIDKLVKYREWLINETERWTEKENNKTNSNAGKHCCIGAANALISARAKFEEIFDYESWHKNVRDKVEPKFKVGDWIISHYNHVAYIKSIDEKDYFLSCSDGNSERLSIDYINRNWCLWTIKDAKDGDVLSFNDGHGNDCIELIKSITDKKIEFWFCLTNGNRYEVFDGIVPYTNLASREDAAPATKEQRDLLFQKIKEAGYEWDGEKKELKKIEQKTAEWSEDEKERKRVVGLLEGWLYTFKETCYAEDCKCGISWLKSLKPKSHWKPSVAQMNALQCFLEHGCAAPDREASFAEKHLEELYNDLIKLLKQ